MSLRSIVYEDQYAASVAKHRRPPMGKVHLHFLTRCKAKELWVVRKRRSHLCGTARCWRVTIQVDPDGDEA